MEIRKELENLLHEAMRNKDELTKNTVRMVLSSIKFAEIETRKPLDDQGIISVLQKEVKMRKETINELEDADRSDLIEKAEAEMKILEKFLPAQLSDEDIKAMAQKVMADVAATTPADMGKVMKNLLPLIKGQAAPDRVSSIVRQLLS
jgi:uncharacterized protein YqeY